MANLPYKPVQHQHEKFLNRAKTRDGFQQTYDALGPEYELLDQMLKARARAGLTQEGVAQRMGTTKSAVSRLESAGSKHAPSLLTLKRYAQAVGCDVKIKLVPQG
jgi:DNA-binding XRE family transcriptional regulator